MSTSTQESQSDSSKAEGEEIGTDLEVTVDSAAVLNHSQDAFSDLFRAGVGYGMFLVGLSAFSEGDEMTWTGATVLIVAVSLTVGWLHGKQCFSRCSASGSRAKWETVAHLCVVSVVLLAGVGVGHSVALSCISVSFLLMPAIVKTRYLSRYYMLAKAGAPIWVLVTAIRVDYWVTAAILVGAVLSSYAIGIVFDGVLGARIFQSLGQGQETWSADKNTRIKFYHVAIAVAGNRTVLLVYYFYRVHTALSAQWLVTLAATVICFGVIGEIQFSALGIAGRKRAAVWACVWSVATAVAVSVVEMLQRTDPVYLVFVAAADAMILFPVTSSVVIEIMEKDPETQSLIYKERAWDAAITCFLCVVSFSTGVTPHPFVCALTVYMYMHLDEFSGNKPAGHDIGEALDRVEAAERAEAARNGPAGASHVDVSDDHFQAVSELEAVSPTDSDTDEQEVQLDSH